MLGTRHCAFTLCSLMSLRGGLNKFALRLEACLTRYERASLGLTDCGEVRALGFCMYDIEGVR